MAYDSTLAARVRSALQDDSNVVEKKMFGGLAFLHDTHMFVGINDASLMVRTGPAAHAAALAKPYVREMAFTGRPMGGYVYVDAGGLATDAQLKEWIELALSFVRTLPPQDDW